MALDLAEQYERLYRYCYHKLHNVQAAEDAAQETVARYLAAGAPGQGTEAVKYLYAVARNLCADQFRAGRTEPLPEELPAPAGPDRDTLLTLRAAVARLSEAEREIIILRYVNQESVSATAAALGMSRFALYRRTAAVLKKLRREMEDDR